MTSQSDNNLITLKNVGLYYKRSHLFASKRRGVFWALKDVSMQLGKGETLGVIGRNGAGKSTLLKILAGILDPDRGQMIKQPCQAALLSLQVGFVPHLTGRENIVLSGLLLGNTRKQIEYAMEDIIAFAELNEFINQPIQTYSTGMKARLGFAVAFHTDPDVLLVDETLGVGDAEFKQRSSAKMKERIRSHKTVVLVSHSARIISQLCDRAVWIEHGKSLAEGPTEEVLKAYEDSQIQRKTVS